MTARFTPFGKIQFLIDSMKNKIEELERNIHDYTDLGKCSVLSCNKTSFNTIMANPSSPKTKRINVLLVPLCRKHFQKLDAISDFWELKPQQDYVENKYLDKYLENWGANK